jgi:hypothetical protein
MPEQEVAVPEISSCPGQLVGYSYRPAACSGSYAAVLLYAVIKDALLNIASEASLTEQEGAEASDYHTLCQGASLIRK